MGLRQRAGKKKGSNQRAGKNVILKKKKKN